MQQELLPTPPSNETEEILKARIERLYRIYGQNWRPFFEQQDKQQDEPDDDADLPQWWLLRQARQLSSTNAITEMK